MIKSYRQIERESKKGQLKKVGRLFSFSRLNLENKISEWKLKRIRKKALRAENTENGSLYKPLSKSDFDRNKILILKIENLNPKHFFKSFKSRIIFTPLQKIRRIKSQKYFVTGLKKSFALITILAVIVTAYWQNGQQASGTTKN